MAVALAAITVLGLLILRIDRRQERPRADERRIEPQPHERPNAGSGDDFDVLIEALDAGTCDWISAPVRLGNRLAVTIGNGTTHRYTFSPSEDRLVRLREAVDRNRVLAP